MRFEIDYPSEGEIEAQRKIIMQKAFSTRMAPPSPRVVFFQCRLSAFISLLIYFCLMFFCASVRPNQTAGGFLALAVFPLTYFSFYYLSILSEEQSELVELKRSLRYTFSYLISLRMLYASLMAVGLNIVLLIVHFQEVGHLWSIGAAGTSATLLLALASLIIYEKTSSPKLSVIMFSVWTVGCLLLMQFGQPLYHLLIEVIPVTVHFAVATASLVAFVAYLGKVEKRNAYGI